MKKILIILLLFVSLIASATNYYVKTGGNDSYTGLSNAQAWATISKVTGKTFSPGDSTFFNRGNTFIGRLNIFSSGSSASPIYFGAYGVGANPIIDANATNAKCISINGSYITIDGIDVKNATTSCGIFTETTAANVIIRNLTVSDIGTTNANIWGIDIRGDNNLVTNCTITGIAGAGIYIGGAGPGISNNNVITYNDITLTNKYYTGNGAGAGIMGTGDHLEVAYNTVHNTGGVGEESSVHGIYIGHDATNVNIHHNTVTGSSRGAGIKFAAGGSCHHNYVTTSFNGGIQVGGNKPGTWPITQNVYSNICTGNKVGIWENNQGTATLILNIYNNTLYLNNNTAHDPYNSELQIDDDINTSLIIENNILYGVDNECTYSFLVPQSHATINYNRVYQAVGDPVGYNGSFHTWAYWQGLGYDAQGINSDPLMVDPPADFHLQSGSPCIGAGVSLGYMITDYDGDTWLNPPSIGAYEYNSGTPPFPYIVRNAGGKILRSVDGKIIRKQ